jgi:protein ImuB
MYAALHAPGNLPILVECAGYFSPWIEEIGPGTVVFDIRGLSLIFGSPHDIAREIHRRIGIPANIALASNPDSAIYLAQGVKGITVALAGEEAAALAPLPLHLLGGDSQFAEILHDWGIRTFGEFAALPPLGVASRLGDEGLRLQHLARGETTRLLKVQSSPLEFHEDTEPETPIELLEPLMFVLAQMLETLCTRLRSCSLSTNEIHLNLKLERMPDHSVTLQLPLPMLDVKVFQKLLQLDLSERPPQAAVQKIYLELKPVEPRTTQHGLFLPSAPEPEKLEITLARIRHLVGSVNVGTPELLDTHRPDSFRLTSLALAKENDPAPEEPTLGLRRYRPRIAAQVLCSEEGRPIRVQSAKAGGRVVACAGPWRTSGDWWTNEPWSHEEWDVELSTGPLLRIHLDLLLKRWFIEGSYD